MLSEGEEREREREREMKTRRRKKGGGDWGGACDRKYYGISNRTVYDARKRIWKNKTGILKIQGTMILQVCPQ